MNYISPLETDWFKLDENGVLSKSIKREYIPYIDIPNGVVEIQRCFGENLILNWAEIPSTVIQIDSYAFKYFNGETLTLPNSLQIIGAGAFSKSKLKEIIIPQKIKAILPNVFKDCKYLKKVTLPDSLEYIDEQAFYRCHSLEEINLPEGLISIGDYAFAECGHLEKMNIPNGCKIGNYAFETYWRKQGLCICCGGELENGRCKSNDCLEGD